MVVVRPATWTGETHVARYLGIMSSSWITFKATVASWINSTAQHSSVPLTDLNVRSSQIPDQANQLSLADRNKE